MAFTDNPLYSICNSLECDEGKVTASRPTRQICAKIFVPQLPPALQAGTRNPGGPLTCALTQRRGVQPYLEAKIESFPFWDPADPKCKTTQFGRVESVCFHPDLHNLQTLEQNLDHLSWLAEGQRCLVPCWQMTVPTRQNWKSENSGNLMELVLMRDLKMRVESLYEWRRVHCPCLFIV